MSDRLLLVEDEEHLATLLAFNLRQEGYEVDAAPTLAAARLVNAHEVHLVVLDVMLPDGNGVQYCAELRRAGVLTPVLMLTAKNAPDDIVAGLEAGADDYLTKPFALREFLSRVAALLRRTRWSREQGGAPASETAGRRVRFGDHEVDFSTHEAWADGKPVELTELELRLLRYFLDRPGQVVSRKALLEGVWEVSSETNTRTIDNFLMRLRRVFERDPAYPRHFVTVRGVGYRFMANP